MRDAAAPLTALKQCRHGRMLYLTTDRYIGRSLDVYAEYCEAESAVFAQLLAPGQVVVEVGANIGAHTVHLAKLVGPSGAVLAFEPQRIVFQILCANLALNEAFNVRTWQAAAGGAPGTLRVPAINYHAPDSNFGAVSLIGIEHGEDVPVIPLDTLGLPSLRLLKIDVEGMEADVLAGATRQIARHRPVLYVENDRRDASAGLISMIQGLGYDLWWHLAYLFNPDNHAGEATNVFANTCSVNLICLPKEEVRTITGFRPVTGPDDWWEDPPAPPPA